MPAQKKTDDDERWEVEIPGTRAVVTEEIDEPDPDTPIDRIARMLAIASDDERASVRLYRVKEKNAHRLEWCKNYSVAEFESGDLEMIRLEWGPGDYQIRLYGKMPGGGLGIRAREEVSIAADPRATSAPLQQQNSELAVVLKTMADQQAAMLQALTHRPEPMDPVKAMMDTMALLGQMKTVLGEGSNSKSQLTDIVAAMREMREVAAEFNPPPPPDDPTGGLLPMGMQLMDLVKTGMQRQAPESVVQAAQAPQLSFPPVHLPPSLARHPTPQKAPEPATAPVQMDLTLNPETPPVDMNQQLDALRSQLLAPVVAMAAAAQPAQDGADFLYEKLPDELFAMLDDPQWFEMLCQLDPTLRTHAAWFAEVHRLMMIMLGEDDAEDVAAEAAAPSAAPIVTGQ